MRFVVLTLIAGLAGCDLNEGPAEETREANEAIREGKRPGEIADQVEDIGDARGHAEVDGDFDRDLRKAEEWAAEQRRNIDEGTREASQDFEKSLNEVQRDLKRIRADIDKPDHDRDTLREELRELSLKIDGLDGEINDKPGKDPIGPG